MRAPIPQVLLLVTLLLVVPARTDKAPCHLQNEELSCELRILQESDQGTQPLLDSSELRNVKSLKVICSNLFYFESTLKSEHFGNLPALEELSIEYCKIRRLPPRAFSGLGSLLRLSVQTHNSEWSSVLMEMESHSLFNLNKIQELNLAYNNLWFLPDNELCHAQSLRLLNLSHNHFVEMSDLKLMDGGERSKDDCSLQLRVLDLSYNLLSAIKTADLVDFGDHLEELHLENNQIGILSEDSLIGLTNLRKIHLSHNRLVALPPTIFRNSSRLESISVVNNSLTLLTPGLFKTCSALVSLNISRNSISSQLISPDTFLGLESLKVLDLSFNDLTELKKGFWTPLESLEVLNLSNNRLHVANEAGLFPAMLQSLFLSHNLLEGMHVEAFSGLIHLKSLSLDSNKFKGFPISNAEQGAFLKDVSLSLEDLTLSSNYLREVPEFVKSLSNLRTLDLGENEISSIEYRDLNSLTKLYGLRLASNALSSLSTEVFINTTSIHVLNLAHNALTEIEKGAFDGLKSSLKALRLDNNHLKDMNGLLSGLEQLQWLNISSNDLQWFDYAFIPSSLEWLDLRWNSIEELGNYYVLQSRFNLKTLDAGHNYIKKLSKSSLPSSLEIIALNDNKIKVLEEHIFANKNNLIKVDLRNNELDSLSLDALTIGKVISQKDLPEFHLSGNPFNCDCNLEWLPRNHEISMSGHHPKVIDLDQITCRGDDDNFPISSKKPEDFICQYKTHCFNLCMCCDFYACDCRMQCPEGCNCYHDADWNTNIIQCSSKNRPDVPLLIPMDATDIYLDGNNLTHVDSQSFIGRKRVSSLYMNNSAVISVSGQTLSGLSNLQVLHLENNEIREITGNEFHYLSSLRELYLNNNNLIRIAPLAFQNLANLALLRLDGNLLTSFPVWDLTRHNPFLNRLFLGENMWSCECEFARPFQRFLYQHVHKIRDGGRIQCFSDNFVSHDVDIATPISPCAKLQKELTSNRLEEASVSSHASQHNLIPIIASVILVAVVTLIGFLSLCVFKSKIKTWLYDKSTEIYESSRRSNTSTISMGETPGGGSKLFDVYVSYAPQDSEFVDQSLAPTLEHGNTSYRLCLHQRDFPPSASLYDTVAVATESSSRVLIILSHAYIQNEWPRMKAPLKNALQNKFCKLIILLLEDIDEDELGGSHPELKQYLKICASVRWGSPGFLNKLRFFLPEPVFLTFQRSVTLRTLQPNVQTSTQNDPSSWAYTVMRRPSESGPSANPTALLCPKYSLTADPSSASVMGSVYSHHTYQSIPELSHFEAGRHVYHTLEPAKFLLSQSQSIYLNKNLDVVKAPGASGGKMTSPASPLEDLEDSLQVCHNHSNSTSSGVQLLPRQGNNANDNNEYVV